MPVVKACNFVFYLIFIYISYFVIILRTKYINGSWSMSRGLFALITIARNICLIRKLNVFFFQFDSGAPVGKAFPAISKICIFTN